MVITILVAATPALGIGLPKEEWEKFYQVPEYARFNSTAEENGLNGTLLKIEGRVVANESIREGIMWTVMHKDGDLWGILLTADYKDVELGSEIICYGVYIGAAKNFDTLPVVKPMRLQVTLVMREKKVKLTDKYEGLSFEEIQELLTKKK